MKLFPRIGHQSGVQTRTSSLFEVCIKETIKCLDLELTDVTQRSGPEARVVTDALEGLTAARSLLASGQWDTLLAAMTLPADLARAEVRFPARSVIAAQEFSARCVPELADGDPTELLRVGPALQADDVAIVVADVLVVVLNKGKTNRI